MPPEKTFQTFAPELFLLAEGHGQVIGALLGGGDGWRGHIARLAAHPDYRRRGVAPTLVLDVELRLRRRGAIRMYALADRLSPQVIRRGMRHLRSLSV